MSAKSTVIISNNGEGPNMEITVTVFSSADNGMVIAPTAVFGAANENHTVNLFVSRIARGGIVTSVDNFLPLNNSISFEVDQTADVLRDTISQSIGLISSEVSGVLFDISPKERVKIIVCDTNSPAAVPFYRKVE
jgi:hypothetical protein